MPTTTETIARGGEWLLQSGEPDDVFTPERLTDEHRLIARTAEEFVANEILPVLDKLEEKDWSLARQLVKRAADLGLMGVDVPEEYGGLGLDKVTSLIVSDPAVSVRNRGAEAEISAEAAVRRVDRRVRPQRNGIGFRRPRRAHARDEAARRQLRPQRREDVDHQRRLRRPVRRVRESDK